jgi:hypothetical protein
VKYRVVPFSASIGQSSGASDVAAQLESLIQSEVASGWTYVRLETVETHVAGSSGCFGFGATPGHVTSYPVAVFQRNDT